MRGTWQSTMTTSIICSVVSTHLLGLRLYDFLRASMALVLLELFNRFLMRPGHHPLHWSWTGAVSFTMMSLRTLLRAEVLNTTLQILQVMVLTSKDSTEHCKASSTVT